MSSILPPVHFVHICQFIGRILYRAVNLFDLSAVLDFLFVNNSCLFLLSAHPYEILMGLPVAMDSLQAIVNATERYASS